MLLTREPTTKEAVTILKAIVEAWRTPVEPGHGSAMIRDWQENLENRIQTAAWFLHDIHRCEFVEDHGYHCPEVAERESFGMKCCADHANRRDRYFA